MGKHCSVSAFHGGTIRHCDVDRVATGEIVKNRHGGREEVISGTGVGIGKWLYCGDGGDRR